MRRRGDDSKRDWGMPLIPAPGQSPPLASDIGPRTSGSRIAVSNRTSTAIAAAAFLLLGALPSIGATIWDEAFGIQLQAIGQLVFIGVLNLIVPPVAGPASKLRTMVGLLAIQGSIVGGISSYTGENDWPKWTAYSVLGMSWYFGMRAGEAVGRRFSAAQLTTLILALCWADLALFAPRVYNLGLEVRSPWGSTLWLGFLVSCAVTQYRGRPGVKIMLAFVTGLVATLVSGMRLTTVTALAAPMLTFLYLRWHHFRVARPVARFALVATLLTIVAVATFPDLWRRASEKLQTVGDRLGRSIFSDTEVHLDEGGEGREAEADRALDEFGARKDDLKTVAGCGHGFVYRDPWGKDSAHVHITPIAFYVRYGLVGVVAFFILLVFVIVAACGSFLSPVSELRVILFGIDLELTLTWVGALFAGLLVLPAPWLCLGLSLGIRSQIRAADRDASSHRSHRCR